MRGTDTDFFIIKILFSLYDIKLIVLAEFRIHLGFIVHKSSCNEVHVSA